MACCGLRAEIIGSFGKMKSRFNRSLPSLTTLVKLDVTYKMLSSNDWKYRINWITR